MSNCPWGASVFIFLTENYFQVPTVYLGRICYWATKYRRKPTAPITASRATWYNYLYTLFLEQKRPTSVAMSPEILNRRIGQVDSLDHTFLRFFCKKSPWTSKKSTLSLASSLNQFCEKALNFLQNQPAVQQARFIEICKEDLRFLLNQTAVLVLSKQIFLEKPSNFN